MLEIAGGIILALILIPILIWMSGVVLGGIVYAVIVPVAIFGSGVAKAIEKARGIKSKIAKTAGTTETDPRDRLTDQSVKIANEAMTVVFKVSVLGAIHLAACVAVLWWLSETWVDGFVGLYCVPIVIAVLWRWGKVMTWRVAEVIQRKEVPESMFLLWYGKNGIRQR